MIARARSSRPKLQATYIPEEHGIAWWGVLDIPAAMSRAGLPSARMATLRLAVPGDSGVVAADVEVGITELSAVVGTALRSIRPATLDASARAWMDACRVASEGSAGRVDGAPTLEDVALRLPTAGHAVLNADETAIMTPTVLIDHFRTAIATVRALGSGALRAHLRPYQAHGVSWLRERAARGEGGILADEMGLGKTLQAIALVATRTSAGPHLVVCPTSLIGNWQREIARFAPQVRAVRHHGPNRSLPESIPAGTVVITGYPALRTDEDLRVREWDVVIFDEAQQLKNPASRATRSAAALRASSRIAMTGTPVENNLEELWAIFSVTNPGALGTRARFRQRFVTPIEQRRSPTAVARLTDIVDRHMLRRTKVQVAGDLPPRVDSTVVCTLSTEQITLYRDAVDRAFRDGLGSGAGRSGRVLALLTELKQICNHPSQYLGTDDGGIGRSGKFDRATEMLTEIVDDGDRALVFTQYRAMGELLVSGLSELIGGPRIPFLHGGLSVDRRDALVRAFQEDDDSPPVLILSLRAAGFGLNLTRASHVVHFDRWWNPAVEEQATARAHRIGQRRTLTVHTLITGGTLEEHIDRMHREKKGLADIVTGDSPEGLATLPDVQLRELLDLDLGELT